MTLTVECINLVKFRTIERLNREVELSRVRYRDRLDLLQFLFSLVRIENHVVFAFHAVECLDEQVIVLNEAGSEHRLVKANNRFGFLINPKHFVDLQVRQLLALVVEDYGFEEPVVRVGHTKHVSRIVLLDIIHDHPFTFDIDREHQVVGFQPIHLHLAYLLPLISCQSDAML